MLPIGVYINELFDIFGKYLFAFLVRLITLILVIYEATAMK